MIRIGRTVLAATLCGIIAVAAAGLSPAAAGAVRDIIIDQSSVLQRYQAPLTRPPSIGVTITGAVAGVAPEKLADVRFVLRRVDLEGAVTLDPALLAPLYAGMIGREITALDLKGVLDGIERIYREHDYYALALAPPQALSSGAVRIIVYESYIRDVVIEADLAGVRNLEARLQPYIDRIVAMRPVRISRLARYALLMTDLAGVTINAELSRIPEEPGAGLLVLKIDFDPSSARLRLDNFASPDIGPLELAGNVRFNNAFGFFEWTDGLAVTNPAAPEELVFARLAQHVPLGPSGFAAGYEYGRVWSNPDDEVDIHAETTMGRVYVDYAVLRALDRNLIATFAIDAKDTAVDVDGAAVVRQRKRWASVGATYDDTILGAAAIASAAFAHGIDGLDATGEGNNDFRFATFDASVSRKVSEMVSAKLFFTGQYAFTNLPSAAAFTLGGETYGRAFDNSAIAGDSGYAAAFELSRRLDFGIDWLTAFSLFGFLDYGAVWNPPGRGGYDFASLGSAGVGFRSIIGRHLMASAWVAVPYKDEPALGAEGTRVRFNAGVQF
ncbi:MAG: ShlB/FhaC/HecB family hemolysin secretion/activation protein [Bauldia sp.]|nr:ShlB/FhaC/HecB family hemolysin secretion/activation protein [Bauldia sp.]